MSTEPDNAVATIEGYSEEALDRVGRVLDDRFEIHDILGEGGFGAVYKALDRTTGAHVALKCLHAHLLGHKEVVTRFRREARAAGEIGHEGIVAVHDFVQLSDGTLAMAMEMLTGEDLGGYVWRRHEAFRVGEACRIIQAVCAPLGAAHAQGILHRDLKPDNIHLPDGYTESTPNPKVKLLDFGVSKFAAAMDGASLMTRTGTTVGTPFYMSPEQAQGKKGIDQRADIYSLGVILFRLLTDQHPFEDESYPMLVLKICTEEPPPIRRYRTDVPDALDRLVRSMLAKSPDERPTDCAAVAAALGSFTSHDVDPIVMKAPRTSATTPAVLSPSRDLAHARTAISDEHHAELDRDETASLAGPAWLKPLALGFIAIFALSVVGYFVLRDPPAPRDRPEPTRPRLPEAAEVVRNPLRAPPSTGLGWGFVHPRPRAMPQWRSVEVGGPGLVGFVGAQGRAGRFVNGVLQITPTGTEEVLNAMAWAGPGIAMVVGENGTMRALLSSGPQVVETGTTASLRDVQMPSLTEAVVVGDHGTVLYFRDLVGEVIETGTESTLFGVHELREGVVIAVGQHGTILRVDTSRDARASGEAVTRERVDTQVILRAVGGCPDGDMYAVGQGGTVVRRVPPATDDEEVRWARVQGTGNAEFTGVTCDGDRAAASTTDGGVVLLSGDRSVRLEMGDGLPFRGISGARDEATWVVGDAGRIAKVDHDHLVALTEGTSRRVLDMATLGGTVVAVGGWGTLIRYGENGFSLADTGTDAAIAGIARYGPGKLIAVGDAGEIHLVRWDAFTPVPTTDPRSLRDVVGGDEWFAAVGASGVIVRGTVESHQTTTVVGVETLWAIDGPPTAAVAVGDEGVILRVTRDATERVGCDAVHGVSLRGVHVVGQDDFYVAGDAGLIARVRGGECTVERRGGPRLNDIAPGPDGRLIAVGQGGTAYERAQDGSWTEFTVGAELDLETVLLTDRDVYVGGELGAILRRARVDRAGTRGGAGGGTTG